MQYPAVFMTLEGFSETQIFKYLSNHIFAVLIFGNTLAINVIFFSKCSKFDHKFTKAAET